AWESRCAVWAPRRSCARAPVPARPAAVRAVPAPVSVRPAAPARSSWPPAAATPAGLRRAKTAPSRTGRRGRRGRPGCWSSRAGTSGRDSLLADRLQTDQADLQVAGFTQRIHDAHQVGVFDGLVATDE